MSVSRSKKGKEDLTLQKQSLSVGHSTPLTEKSGRDDPNATVVNTRKIITAEQIRRKAESAVDNESEDTSVLLKIDNAPLREVNDALWWSYDAACALIVTYITHPAHPGSDVAAHEPTLSMIQRLLAAMYILGVGFILQQLYFKSGLDR